MIDSDATLIIAEPPLTGGTRLTEQLAIDSDKALFICRPSVSPPDELLVAIVETPIRCLNVAGPRDDDGLVYDTAAQFMRALLTRLA